MRVRVATDGPSGLAAALHLSPDVLLLDIRLPGFDGYELPARIRRAPGGGAGITVIVLSNYGELDVIDHGVALGVSEHLVKSQTTPAALTAAIRRHLRETALPI